MGGGGGEATHLGHVFLVDDAVVGAVLGDGLLKAQDRGPRRLPRLVVPDRHDLDHMAHLALVPQALAHVGDHVHDPLDVEDAEPRDLLGRLDAVLLGQRPEGVAGGRDQVAPIPARGAADEGARLEHRDVAVASGLVL